VQDQDSGSSTPVSLASYDLDTQSWRTSERLLTGDLIEFSGALPKSGTMRNGRIYALPTWERRIAANEYGLWPTPSVNDSKNDGAPSQLLRHSPGLNTVAKLWPTPRTKGMCGGTGNWNQLKEKCENIEEARKMGAGNGGQLNPTFVEYLMNYPKGWTDLTLTEPLHIMGYHGKKTDCLSEEELRVLRGGIDPQELQRDARRSRGIHAPKILRPGVYGECDDSERCEPSCAQEAGSQVSRQNLRELRRENESGYPSSGLESGEQFTGQSDDIVQFLSCEMALDSWEKEIKAPDCLQNMRRACSEIGYVPKTLSEIQEIWRSATDEEKDWLKIRIGTRNPWHAEWPGVPRVAKSVPSRVDRLKCLGNSIVPQIAELIFLQPAFDEWMHK